MIAPPGSGSRQGPFAGGFDPSRVLANKPLNRYGQGVVRRFVKSGAKAPRGTTVEQYLDKLVAGGEPLDAEKFYAGVTGLSMAQALYAKHPNPKEFTSTNISRGIRYGVNKGWITEQEAAMANQPTIQRPGVGASVQPSIKKGTI